MLAAIAASAVLLAALPGASGAQSQITGCLDQDYELPGRVWWVDTGAAPWSACDSNGLAQISWRVNPQKGTKGAQGQRGNRGPKGRPGEPGEQGERGLRGERGEHGTFPVYTVQSACQTCTEAGASPAAAVTCDPGDVALGGGFITDGLILGSLSTGGERPDGWSAPAAVAAEGSLGSQAQLVCHDRPPLRR